MNCRLPIADCRFLGALALLFFAPFLRAANVEVSAGLTQSSTAVGQPVQYQIHITGARSGNPPSQIRVDGLEINYIGNFEQMQMNNFNVTWSVIYSYLVKPQQPGKFTIPAQTVEVGGKKYVTTAVTLDVGGGSAGGANGGGQSIQGGSPVVNSRDILAEIVLPRQTAYVGEAIPVEFRIYLDNRIRRNIGEQPPMLNGDGFTVQKFTPPRETEINRDGHNYAVFTFKTAITPVKPGELTLGPGELNFVIQVPRQRRPRTGNPLDDFFNDDAFGDVFGMAQAQQIRVTSDPVKIEAKPLPSANQPKNFSGAVGQFTLGVEAAPKKVKAGDPITLTAKITGRGNFDRLNAPRLADETGWRTYPPTGKFNADDDVGISGAKTFEMAVIPEEKKTKMPALEFAYFDPVEEKYVTLSGQQEPIEVSGGAPPAPATSASAAAVPRASAAPSAAPTPTPNDILYIRTDAKSWDGSFTPVYRTRGFWLLQLVPLAGLAAFAATQIATRNRRDAAALRLAELRREKSGQMKKLTARGTDDGAFFEAAAKYLRVETSLRTGRDAALIDAGEVCAAAHLDAVDAEKIHSLFAANAELRYAGAGRASSHLSPEKRDEILETLRKFDHARL